MYIHIYRAPSREGGRTQVSAIRLAHCLQMIANFPVASPQILARKVSCLCLCRWLPRLLFWLSHLRNFLCFSHAAVAVSLNWPTADTSFQCKVLSVLSTQHPILVWLRRDDAWRKNFKSSRIGKQNMQISGDDLMETVTSCANCAAICINQLNLVCLFLLLFLKYFFKIDIKNSETQF